MYIIVVGGGKVGFYLGRELLEEGHEVLIIERDQKDPHRSEWIAEELGSESVLRGDGCEAATLELAGAARADMLIAVTGEDEDNLVSCQVAKNRFKVPRVIARINNPKNEFVFQRLGIDSAISATAAIMAQIEQELPTHHVVPLLTLPGGVLHMVEVKIPEGSPAVGKLLGEILLPESALVSLVIDSAGVAKLPTPDTIIHADDEIVAVARPDMEGALLRALTGAGAGAQA